LFSSIKPSILIVDDDLAILRCFSKIFERKGYCVTVAERGSEALEKINVSKFDVALVDWGLPDMEGVELLPVIASKSPKTLRVMLTGKACMQNSVGADVFLGKPVSLDRLLSIIDNELKLRDIET
jgi:DNA-binding NtrC family response regulator